VLRVASSHLHDCRVHLEPFAAGVLKATLAMLAEGQRQLVARSPGVFAGVVVQGLSAAEDVPRHEQEGRVVVQVLAALTAKLIHRVAKGREGLGGHLEAKHMADRVRSRAIARSITTLMAGDEPLDVADRSAFRSVEPILLRHGCCHPS
jgi:hypothetical protein